MRIGTVALTIGTLLATSSLLAATARANVKCEETLVKGAAKAARVMTRLLQRCEQLTYEGEMSGACPDPATARQIAAAKAHLAAIAAKACTNSTGEFPLGGRCPDVDGGTGPAPCTGMLIQSKADEGACLACLAEENASELIESLTYGTAITPPPSRAVAKCQGAIGFAVRDFYNASSKALSDCTAGLLRHQRPNGCPDQRALDLIAKAERRKVARIAKDCCGDDGNCGGTCIAGGGGAAIGADCASSADCQRCMGGAFAGGPCQHDAECLDGACSSDGECRGDDLDPVADLGFPVACPVVPAIGQSTEPIGQTMQNLITCLDDQASARALCQGPGLKFGELPAGCVASPVACKSDGGTVTVTVSIDAPAAGVSLGLGYLGVTLPHLGELVEGRISVLQPPPLWVANNTGDQVIFSAVTFEGLVPGPLFSVQFETCGTMPTLSNFGCVVRSGSDPNGQEISAGLSCSVAVE